MTAPAKVPPVARRGDPARAVRPLGGGLVVDGLGRRRCRDGIGPAPQRQEDGRGGGRAVQQL